LGFVFGCSSLMVRVWFYLGSQYFKKIGFMFSSSSVNVGFGFSAEQMVGKESPILQMSVGFRT